MEILSGKYCVYIHTNKANGKVYVGQTCQKPEKRWKGGSGYEKCPYFYHAIQKYGWDGFEHEVIASNLTLEEANKFEKILIEKLETTNSAFGYNLSAGGSGTSGPKPEEVKRKISKALGKKVRCIETGVIYDSAADAQRATGACHVSLVCNGTRKSAGGFHWEYVNA